MVIIIYIDCNEKKKCITIFFWAISPVKVEQETTLPTSLTLTLLLVSRGGSWGFRQACATLITCSSFLGCSSTLAARNRAVGEMIWLKRAKN